MDTWLGQGKLAHYHKGTLLDAKLEEHNILKIPRPQLQPLNSLRGVYYLVAIGSCKLNASQEKKNLEDYFFLGFCHPVQTIIVLL